MKKDTPKVTRSRMRMVVCALNEIQKHCIHKRKLIIVETFTTNQITCRDCGKLFK